MNCNYYIWMTLIASVAISLDGRAQDVGNAGTIVNCEAGASLPAAVALAQVNETLILRGSCAGPVIVTTDGLTLRGIGGASIQGQQKDVITVNGAQRISLMNLKVTGGNNGVVTENGAQVNLQNVTITGNALVGLQLEANSAATVSGGSANGNALNGIDVESTSSLTITGTYSVVGNGVFGININGGSSLTLMQGNLTVTSNTLGIQLGTAAAGFIADSVSQMNVSNNATTGLTIVSGAHMVDFGGAITCTGNGIHGISVDSKAGLDLDAGSVVTSNSNVGDGLHLEETSVVTVFNNPAFSGVQGTTTVNALNNQANGISLETSSNLTVINFAALNVSGNSLAGLAVDDGSNLSFANTVPVSGVQTSVSGNKPDVALSFGSRATTLSNVSIGTATCDATTLVRGPFPATCPGARK